MAKQPPKDRPTVETPSAESLEPAPAPPKRWRTVAFATRSAKVYLGGGFATVLGGEFLVDPTHVEQVKSDPVFRLIDVASPQELAELQADHARAMAELRERAKELGLVVYRDGEVPAPRAKG